MHAACISLWFSLLFTVLMIVLSWNCKGAVSKEFGRVFRDIVRVHKPDIVALQEPRCTGIRARNRIRSLGFNYSEVIYCNGFSGGIWLMWKDVNLKVLVLIRNPHFLHVKVEDGSGEVFFLTVVYASPREGERAITWADLEEVSIHVNGCWLMMGDFNKITSVEEKKGGAEVNHQRCNEFAQWINKCNLHVELVGTRFTWRGLKRDGLERVFERLDRVLCNLDWRLKYHEGFAKVLHRVYSDHHPIATFSNWVQHANQPRPFRFEAAWMMHEGFIELTKNCWNDSLEVDETLKSLKASLQSYNKATFGNIICRKNKLMARIGGI